MLMEFSELDFSLTRSVITNLIPVTCSGYHLTKDTPSPGTPERPLSELGAIGYESFWIKIVLRSLVGLLIGEESEWPGEGRWWKEKRVLVKQAMVTGGFLRWHGVWNVRVMSGGRC